jgi:hypothetical protein
MIKMHQPLRDTANKFLIVSGPGTGKSHLSIELRIGAKNADARCCNELCPKIGRGFAERHRSEVKRRAKV